jgi:CHAD domain-containing protein
MMKPDNMSKNKHDTNPPAPSAAVKAAYLTLSKKMTVEQLFQAIATNCLVQVEANRAGVVQVLDAENGQGAESVECVHQMRVGLRRLRCAFGLFKKVLQVPAQLRQEFDWLGTQLGAARDWDVLADSTIPVFVAMVPAKAELAGLSPAVLGKAHAQHEVAAAALNSARYTQLMSNFTDWVQGCGWRGHLSPEDQQHLAAPAMPFVCHALMQSRHRLFRQQQKIDAVSPQACHRVRITGKKMRYMAEFFVDLYPAKKMRATIAALSKLQDQLGALNDALVADRLLVQLQQEQAALAAGAGYLRGYLAAEVEINIRKICKRWAKVKPIKLPRSVFA